MDGIFFSIFNQTMLNGTSSGNMDDNLSMYEMKDWIMPPSELEIFGLTVVGAMVILGNAGGLGGGGLLIPFIMIFLKLPLKECIAVGNFLGFLAALIRFLVNF